MSGLTGLWATEIEIGRPERAAIVVHQLELVVEVDEVADDLQHALADRAERLGDADQLVGLGGQRRGQLAAAAAVVQRARRGEAEGAGEHGLAGQVGHRRDVVGRRRLARCATLAHHVQAQRAVGDLGAEVDVAWMALEVVEVLREGLPRPRQALVQRHAGDVLDAFHQLDEALVVGGPHRGEADAAVAHHGGRDAVPARRGQLDVPGRLAVVVGVDVDEAGRDEGAVGVELATAAPSTSPTSVMTPSSMATSAVRAGEPGAVDHSTGADDEIVHGPPPLGRVPVSRRR